jgi:hypothetical protein
MVLIALFRDHPSRNGIQRTISCAAQRHATAHGEDVGPLGDLQWGSRRHAATGVQGWTGPAHDRRLSRGLRPGEKPQGSYGVKRTRDELDGCRIRTVKRRHPEGCGARALWAVGPTGSLRGAVRGGRASDNGA